jgi:hypothetical protein
MTTHALRCWCLAVVLAWGALPLCAADEPIDWDRARQLREKWRAGQVLTDEERAYLQRAMQSRGRAGQRGPQPARAAQPAALDIKPLTEFGPEETYKGEPGGLYGRGRNDPPPAHQAAATRATQAIRPLDADGTPAADGRIVLISVGMSNTTQEFSRFIALANQEQKKSPRVVIVDGAQGGQDAADWANPQARLRQDRRSPWAGLEQRLGQAGVTAQQVQVAWIKQALRNPARLGEFPAHARKLQADLAAIVRELKRRFPNLQVVYLSSRIYAGYATSALNPEPYAFESGFAVRWLIEAQMGGDPQLNHDPARGEVVAPLLLWGPYLWADAQTPRQSDALTYAREDFAADGTHPSGSGRQKVAEQLMKFFTTDPLARAWFVAR